MRESLCVVDDDFLSALHAQYIFDVIVIFPEKLYPFSGKDFTINMEVLHFNSVFLL